MASRIAFPIFFFFVMWIALAQSQYIPDSSSTFGGSSSGSSSSFGGDDNVGSFNLGGSDTGGCSSNFWAQNTNSWPNLLNIYTKVTQVLGEISYTLLGGSTTLLSGLQNQSKDPYSSLLRETIAALLNSYSNPSFKYSPSTIQSSFQSALGSPRSAAYQASLFQHANRGGVYGVSSQSCS